MLSHKFLRPAMSRVYHDIENHSFARIILLSSYIFELFLSIHIFFVVCFATIYILNPFFWPSWTQLHTGDAVHELTSFSHDVTTRKIVLWHQEDLRRAEFQYPQLRNLSHPLEFPLLFGRWSHEMHRQLAMGLANWNGSRSLRLNKSLFQLSVPLATVTNGFDGTSVLMKQMPPDNSWAVSGFAFTVGDRRVEGRSSAPATRGRCSRMRSRPGRPPPCSSRSGRACSLDLALSDALAPCRRPESPPHAVSPRRRRLVDARARVATWRR